MDFSGMRVLIVEDEAMISMLMEEFLEELGCEITGTASRLDDALEKARSLMVDLALLDVNLAGRLSYPVAELLLARGVPVVFSTGYGAAALPEALHGVT
ncbi:MAG: response regulator, partial [Janthinobacterium lividum]